MIYEIRSYHFDPKRFDEYCHWAKTRAMPCLRANLNVIGFWANTSTPAQILGKPMDELGPANITWIIGWEDVSTRDATLDRLFSSPEWGEIFKHVPGGLDSYIRRESKFAQSLM